MSSDPKNNRHQINIPSVVDANVVDADIVATDNASSSTQYTSQSEVAVSQDAELSNHDHNSDDLSNSSLNCEGVSTNHEKLSLPLIPSIETANSITEHLNSSFTKQFASNNAQFNHRDRTFNDSNKINSVDYLSDAEGLVDNDLEEYELDINQDDAEFSSELDSDHKELSFDDDFRPYLSSNSAHRDFNYAEDDDFYDVSGNSVLDDYEGEDLNGMHFMHESHASDYDIDANEDDISGAVLNKLLSMEPKKSIEAGLGRSIGHPIKDFKNIGSSGKNALLVKSGDSFYQNYNENSGYELEHDSEDEKDRKTNLSSSTAIVRASNPNSIGSFVKAASQIPLLSEEEEHDLARRLRDFGDMDAARKLVLSHLRLVVSVARRYAGYGLPLSDLIQEGNIGLMKSVKHFDPNVGGRLAAFAVHWIKAEIHEYVIRNWRMVKVATTKAQRKLFFKLRQNKKRLGWFTEKERNQVASDLGVTSHDVAEMETRLAGVDIGFDLDDADSNDHSTALTLSPSSYLEDESSDFAHAYEQHDYASWELKKLHDALNELDARSRYILQRRWLDENKATLQELSGELKVSIERVRQLENNAMNKVKALLLNDGVSKNSEDSDANSLVKIGTSSKKQVKATAKKPRVKRADTNADSSNKTNPESNNKEVMLLESKIAKTISNPPALQEDTKAVEKAFAETKKKSVVKAESKSSNNANSDEEENSKMLQTVGPAKRGRKPKALGTDASDVKALPHLKSEISHDKALVVTKTKV